MDISESLVVLYNAAAKLGDNRVLDACKLVEEKFTSTNTGSPKLCRSCIKLYACVKAGDNIMGCCEFEQIAA